MQASVALRNRFRGAQQARQAPRTNVRELFCGSKITRNGSDEAERSERNPSGAVSAANDEELAAAGGQVSGEAAPAGGSASQPGRRRGAHYPPGSLPVPAFKKSSPSGQLCRFLLRCRVEYKTHVRLESGAEAGFAAPLGSALQGCRAAFPGIVPTDFHGLTRKARKLQGCGSAFPGRLVVLW